MFEIIKAAPADPILGLTEAFKNDPRGHKVNLGVGIYKDEAGQTPILATVKEAETRLLAKEKSKSYLSIEGSQEYGAAVQRLLFGKDAEIIASGRAFTAQAPGGTGALRVGAEFYAKQLANRKVWISNPTWPNHVQVFQAAGLEVAHYDYYDAASHDKNFDAMLASLEGAKAGDLVLFHGCCHNPTGIDPTTAEWETLAKLSAAKGWLPLFDFAYQGFGKGLDEDAAGLRLFAKYNKELLIASSFSKNFGLYRERTGALVAHGEQVLHVFGGEHEGDWPAPARDADGFALGAVDQFAKAILGLDGSHGAHEPLLSELANTAIIDIPKPAASCTAAPVRDVSLAASPVPPCRWC